MIAIGSSKYRFLKRIYRLIASSTCLRHLLFEVWHYISVLLLTPTMNATTSRAVNKLKLLITTTKNYEAKNKCLSIFKNDHLPSIPAVEIQQLNVVNNERFYEKSATYLAFKEVADKVEKMIVFDVNEPANPFYSPKFHWYLLVSQAPYIISVSAITTR